MKPELVRETTTAVRHPRPETIHGYLQALRRELAGADPALVQDALASAEEYLRSAQAEAGGVEGAAAERALVERTLERYGTPEEVAEAYRESERRRAVPGPFPSPEHEASLPRRIFGVLADPRAYGSAFYMFLALALGIIYFVWAAVGVSLSIGLVPVALIGLALGVVFLASLQGIALVEGRIVEGLLGERMPRRSAAAAGGGWKERILGWLRDGRTWTTLVYMVAMLPLGIFYFTLFAVMLSLTLGIAIAPFVQLFFDQAIIGFGRYRIDLPLAAFPLVWFAAAFDLLVFLHLARAVGRLHGRFAKAMLVRR